MRSVSLCTLSLILFSPCPAISQNQIPLQVFPNTLSAEPVPEKNSDKILDHEFSEYMERMMEMWEVKGTTIALVRPDGEVEFGAYGIKTEDGEKITPDTLLNIGSCSKAFLASTMGILMDDFQQGRNQTELPPGVNSFTWNTKVKDLLPGEWELWDHWANEKVDILDIMSHRSGLPSHEGARTQQGTAQDVVKRMKYLRPTHEPRQKFAYSNLMYTVGSYIIKKYAPTYDNPSFITDRIFSPLGMTSTTFSPEQAMRSGKLSQSWSAHRRRIPFWYTDESVDLIAGPGGVISNVVDLSRWLKVLLNKGINPASNKTVLPRSVYDMVTTAHTLMIGDSTNPQFSIAAYGMGWYRTSFRGHEMLQHAGAIPGFSSTMTFFPNDGFGIAILMNTAGKAAVNEAISLRIAEDVLGLDRTPRADDPIAVNPKRKSRDPNANTALPLSAYAGVYYNPGYGSLTICAHSSTLDDHCAKVLNDFAIVDGAQSAPLPPNTTTPQLYAEWSRVWSTHVRMTLVRNDTFEIVLTSLFPQGYGTNKEPFEAYELDAYIGQGIFVLDEGKEKIIGFGLFDPDDPRMQHALGDASGVKEGSIVWFDKI